MARREQAERAERLRAERLRAMLQQTNARRAERLRAMVQQVAQLLDGPADGQLADSGAWEQAHQLLKDATALALQGSVMAHNNRKGGAS